MEAFVAFLVAIVMLVLLVGYLRRLGRRELAEAAEHSVGQSVGRTFPTKIVGVTRNNQDGTSRQALIADLRIGQRVRIVREPDNPADPNAVMVCTEHGDQLGYLDARLAGEVSRLLERGGQAAAKVHDLLGGTEEFPTRGVVLAFTKIEPDA